MLQFLKPISDITDGVVSCLTQFLDLPLIALHVSVGIYGMVYLLYLGAYQVPGDLLMVPDLAVAGVLDLEGGYTGGEVFYPESGLRM